MCHIHVNKILSNMQCHVSHMQLGVINDVDCMCYMYTYDSCRHPVITYPLFPWQHTCYCVQIRGSMGISKVNKVNDLSKDVIILAVTVLNKS